MKCTIERSALLKSLSHVQGVVGKRAAVPILANIYLETRSSRLYLRATDMDLELAETVFCEIERAGCATAPAHMIYEIVKKLPNAVFLNIEHDTDKEQLVIRFGKSSFLLKSLPYGDFPSLMDDVLPVTFSVKATDLRSLIGRTCFAMSTEATRSYLNGISLYAARSNSLDVLRAVATDGYRLARMEIPLPQDANLMPNIILPSKTVRILLSLIDESTVNIVLSLSKTKVRFTFESGMVLLSKLLDGTFPDCERLIPQHNDKMIKINAKLLAEAVGRVTTIIGIDKTRVIKLSVSNKDSLVLSASNATTTDSAVDELDAACAVVPLSIGFNSRYLLDILGQIVSDTVCFAVSDSASPTVVREVADDSALYLLMPMRV